MLADTVSSSRYDEHLTVLTPGERFLKALALSAYVRGLAWQGARLHAESQDAAAVVERFLQQLYGDDVARDVKAWMAARDGK
ncbi:hypothetical protein BH09GEM1_BH09GEM1_27100 [soil metagenome]